MAGYDPMDSTSIDRAVEPAASRAARAISRRARRHRQGIRHRKTGRGDPRALRNGVRRTRDLGAELVEVSLPTADYGLGDVLFDRARPNAAANLARFDGVRYGLRVEGADVGQMYENTRAAGFGPEVKRRILIGTLRTFERVLRRVLRAGAESANAVSRTISKRAFATMRSHRFAGGKFARVYVQLQERSVQHVYDGLLHDSDVARRLAGAFGAVRLGDARRRRPMPMGLQLAAPLFGERKLLGRRPRLRTATRHAARYTPRAGGSAAR